jgi:hypothetical protein
MGSSEWHDPSLTLDLDPRNEVESRQRWQYIARVAVPAGLFTMSLTWFMIRRPR